MIPDIGSKAPDFAVFDSEDVQRRLSELTSAAKHLVLVFYRGHW
jgi:peroxiredoxin